jgi:hypothetical protein
LASVPLRLFALVAGGLSALLSLLAGLLLFRGYPTLVDGMSSLLHGKALAAGRLSFALPDPTAAFLIPNTVLTSEGWVSQYPPLHPLLLAVGHVVGAPWLVGPLCVGAAVALTVLVANHVLPDRPVAARVGGLAAAVSPFLFFLGGGYLSHLPAAAFGALVVYAALRAREGGAGWAALTGAACGGLVACRPWLGIVLGIGLPVGLWAGAAIRSRGLPWVLARFGWAASGGLPFALLLGLYNHRFFGHPLHLGYFLAYGPAHNLGFHRDPWGNMYGALEALGYSSANLLNLGVYLLETPLPALGVVAAFLLLSKRVEPGAWVLLAWGLLPALANVFYWHHGFHLGPRMLYEAAPAWSVLAVLAALGLLRTAGLGQPSDPGPHRPEDRQAAEANRASEGISSARRLRHRLQPHNVLFWAFTLSLLGPLVLVPLRASSYRWTDETLARLELPETPGPRPGLVFVHGSWSERTSARLQESGMRLDSIETAMRRNDACRLHAYTMAYIASSGSSETLRLAEDLDFRLLSDSPPNLRPLVITEGNRVSVDPALELTPECQREVHADRFGIVSLAPLLWQGDLPGAESGKPMMVRDLGPEANRRLMAAFPDREPFLLALTGEGVKPVLRGYEEGMRLLWGGEPEG